MHERHIIRGSRIRASRVVSVVGAWFGRRAAKFRQELAEVHFCYFQMTRAYGLNPLEIMRVKPCVNEQKHPVALSRGCSKKYTELETEQ